MTLFNLHTHTRFSDGSDEPSAYIEEAIRQGFHTLGFTDHAPVPFANTFAIGDDQLGNYFSVISELSSASGIQPLPRPLPFRGGERSIPASSFQHPASSICLLTGLEVDYIPTITSSFSYYHSNFPVDYLIGSVHLVKNKGTDNLWFIDGPDISIYDKGLTEVFGGDAKAGVTAYYRQLQEMIQNEKPDIVGHLDKIKMYNRGRYFSESDSWYVSLVDETLELIKGQGCVVEVNTRGIYKKRSETTFPGPEILKKINDLNIPVTISSDAHKPNEISMYFGEARALLLEIGFKNQVLLTKSGWIDCRLF
jgi:histidinol-phosphatase (PHP family)